MDYNATTGDMWLACWRSTQ